MLSYISKKIALGSHVHLINLRYSNFSLETGDLSTSFHAILASLRQYQPVPCPASENIFLPNHQLPHATFPEVTSINIWTCTHCVLYGLIRHILIIGYNTQKGQLDMPSIFEKVSLIIYQIKIIKGCLCTSSRSVKQFSVPIIASAMTHVSFIIKSQIPAHFLRLYAITKSLVVLFCNTIKHN